MLFVSLLQHTVSVATKTQADEPYPLWRAEVAYLKDITAKDGTRSGNVLWLQRGEVTKCLPCNIRDGVHQLAELISLMVDTGNQTDVEKEKEDLGLTMFMF